MSHIRSTAAIILAAGSSSRMGGRHKLLLPLGGRPVLTHVLEATLASQAQPIVVVLGHQAEQVKEHIIAYTKYPDIIVVENPQYLQGMSTSIHVGVETLMSSDYRKFSASGEIILDSVAPPDPQDAINRVPTEAANPWFEIDSALIMLGDQPLMTPQIIDTLIQVRRKTGKWIVGASYGGKRGNPTLFAANLFPELLEVTGDEGGRRVIERHREELELVKLGNAMVNYDVDTWEAYQQVVNMWEGKREQGHG